MKKIIFLIATLFLLLALTDCEKNKQTSNWNFEATFHITDPDTFDYQAIGTAVVESDENEYKIVADYTVGQMDFNGVLVEGEIDDGTVVIDNKIVIIQFEMQGTTYTETVTFSLPNIDLQENTASGNGPVNVVIEPGNVVENGTIEFTADKQ